MKLNRRISFNDAIKHLDNIVDHEGKSNMINYYTGCMTTPKKYQMGLDGLEDIKEEYLKIISQIFDERIEKLKK